MYTKHPVDCKEIKGLETTFIVYCEKCNKCNLHALMFSIITIIQQVLSVKSAVVLLDMNTCTLFYITTSNNNKEVRSRE